MTKLRITSISNVEEFFKEIDRCIGNVYLLTTDGDKINLKSKISQFIIFSELFDTTYIKEVWLEFDHKEDGARFLADIMYGNFIEVNE